jgi:hypothetical protein
MHCAISHIPGAAGKKSMPGYKMGRPFVILIILPLNLHFPFAEKKKKTQLS